MKISKDKKDIVTGWARKQKSCTESKLLDKLRSGNEEFFELRDVVYPFGTRKVYFKKDQEKYELLQGSRCFFGPQEDSDFESLVETSEAWLHNIKDSDIVRIDELEQIRAGLPELPRFESIAEIGFRTPRLLKYYLDRGYKRAIGFDVLEANVIAAHALGYESKVYDLNLCEGDLDLRGIDLVLSYHVLEHVSDPLRAIKAIYNSMSAGSCFHVEIPIEPGVPNIRYCHLFPFELGDLHWMLQDAGFRVRTIASNTHAGGPDVERHFAVKE